MFNEIAWAEKGKGAWLNDDRLQVSDASSLDNAAVSTGNIASIARSPGWPVLGDILQAAYRTRGYGDFYHYHLLASGKIDAVIESDVNVLDIAALSLIVTEAGGVFTDLEGKDIDLQSRSVLAAPPLLHATLLDRLRGCLDQ